VAQDKGEWQILVDEVGNFLISSMTVSFSRSTTQLQRVGHVFGNVHISTVTSDGLHVSRMYVVFGECFMHLVPVRTSSRLLILRCRFTLFKFYIWFTKFWTFCDAFEFILKFVLCKCCLIGVS
jgi:hypothetical protein